MTERRGIPLATLDTGPWSSIGVWASSSIPGGGTMLTDLRDRLVAAGNLRTSAVIPLPDGWLVRLDRLPPEAERRRSLGDIADEFITDAGLDGSSVRLLTVDGLAGLDDCPDAVVLRVFPEPRGRDGRLDPAWIDLAAEWAFGDRAPDDRVQLRVLGVEIDMPVRDAGGLLADCHQRRAWVDLLTGDMSRRVRTASLTFGRAPHVALAAGGPGCDDAALLARFELLAELAAETGTHYACIDFEADFSGLGFGLADAAWPTRGGAASDLIAGRHIDRFLPEVYPFQIVPPTVVEALATDLPDEIVVHRRADGRAEIRVGDASMWSDSDERAVIQERAESALSAVLARPGDVPDEDGADAIDPTPAPDPDDVVIEAKPHPHRGHRMTILELASRRAGLPHTDSPTSVSPVVATLARGLGAGLGDDDRQRLIPTAPRLLDTAGDGRDEDRVWAVADHALRRVTPRLLDAAGLTESAKRLRAHGSVRRNAPGRDTDLVRAVDLIGSAVQTAARRLELTLELAGDRAADVESLSWDVWDEVSDRSGWSAAMSAMVVGLATDLLGDVDAVVHEAAFDPAIRERLSQRPAALAEALWKAALDQSADQAWHAAWDAAEFLVRNDTGFSLRTTLRRSWEAMPHADDHAGLADVSDAVEQAAATRLSDLLLSGDGTRDWWQECVDAAGHAPDGARWRAALTESSRVLGDVFDDAVDAARGSLRDSADHAPAAVARAVLAAATRMVGSVAGRGIAATVAAAAMAHDDSLADATVAATAALWDATGGSVDEALDLLDELTKGP